MSSGHAVRGNVRAVGYRRVTHGLFLPDPPESDPEAEWRRVLGALLLILPDGATFTGITAARLLGWWLPPLPDWVPVFVSLSSEHGRPSRPGIVVSRFDRDEDHRPGTAHGLPVDEPAEILLRCARDLGVLDLVPMIDRAIATRAATRGDVQKVCERRRAGVPVLRHALDLADPRSESAWESVLRVFHQTIGVPVVVQPQLYDAEGRLVARADLRVTGTRFIHEYDGAGHRSGATHREDLRRDRRLTEAGYLRRGYTADDLVHRAAVTVAEIDRALGRSTRPSRVAAWRRLLDASAFGDVGRERLRNRWVRDMGTREWRHTAE